MNRSSRRKEAHYSKSKIRNPKSEIDESLLTSAATKFKFRGHCGRGLCAIRFMESSHDFQIAHRGQEPATTNFCCICNKSLHRWRRRFMESLHDSRIVHWGDEPCQRVGRGVLTAPRDGIITVNAALKHESENGDGVHGRIVSSRLGVVGDWTVHHDKQQTTVEQLEVKQADTIDFVVDCRGGPDSDSYSWAPTIKWSASDPDGTAALTNSWDAKEDFGGPKSLPKPLDAWERFAQVLLLSNEAMFVD